MPNINEMEKVFLDAVEKYASSNRRLINTYAGVGGKQLDYEKDVLKQEVKVLKDRFEAAKNQD